MKRNLIKADLFLLMKEVLKIEQIDINQTMHDVPEWDSLKHIQLLSSIEEKFNIQIDFEESISMVDVKGILNLITQKLIK
jgi:acyl carrier protein